jgi:hypothetical protein
VSALKKVVVALTLCGATIALPVRAQQRMEGMTGMSPAMPHLPLGIPLSRVGSGTSWLPDSSPMFAASRPAGGWLLMLHGAAFGQYDRQPTVHGDTQIGLTDWEMLTALRQLAGGLARVDMMTSLQPLVDGARGYPELLQSGGTYHGARLANRQHPNEMFMELATAYDHSLTRRLATGLYAAAVGEPALGPVTYMHRPSAAEDPFAPLSHHWQDASHESFGVITGGVYSQAVKLEGSVFNGRDPDDYHLNLDYAGAKLDSYAGRLTVQPVANVSVAAWGGYLFDHDRLDTPVGMQRYGASILTSTSASGGRRWSNAAVWGLNIHHHGAREHNHDTTTTPKSYHLASSVLLESTFNVTQLLSVYGRLEQVQKTADDLGFLGADLTQLFTIREVSVGATRDVVRRGSAALGFGARATLNLLPDLLVPTYQSRTPVGFAIFLRLRPTRMHS